jgi:hypothetical protein
MKFNYYVWTHRSSHHPFSRVSQRFKSIIHLARDKTWQHDTCEPRRHNEWPQFTTMIKELSRAHLTLVHIFHTIPHSGLSVGGPCTIPYTPERYGRVLSNSVTDEATKFAWSHKSRMCQYIIKCLFISTQLMWDLINTGGGYYHWALNL